MQFPQHPSLDPREHALRRLRMDVAGIVDNAHSLGGFTADAQKLIVPAELTHGGDVGRALALARTKLDEARHWASEAARLLELERAGGS